MGYKVNLRFVGKYDILGILKAWRVGAPNGNTVKISLDIIYLLQ